MGLLRGIFRSSPTRSLPDVHLQSTALVYRWEDSSRTKHVVVGLSNLKVFESLRNVLVKALSDKPVSAGLGLIISCSPTNMIMLMPPNMKTTLQRVQRQRTLRRAVQHLEHRIISANYRPRPLPAAARGLRPYLSYVYQEEETTRACRREFTVV